MVKKLIKMFASPEKMAKWSAEGIKKAINNSQKQDMISKYGTMADKATEVQKQITEWLKDGHIDDLEVDQIKEMLVPLYENIFKLI